MERPFSYLRQFIRRQLLWPFNCSAFPPSGTPPQWLTAGDVTATLNHANEDVISSDSGGFISLTVILRMAESWSLLRSLFLFSWRPRWFWETAAGAQRGPFHLSPKSTLIFWQFSFARRLWSSSLPKLLQQKKPHFHISTRLSWFSLRKGQVRICTRMHRELK